MTSATKIFRQSLVAALCWVTAVGPLQAAQADLADAPLGSSGNRNVPANVLFTPSVEFPTAVNQAHITAFDTTKTYIGYFDPYKCYDYDTTNGHFTPKSYTIGVTAIGDKPVRTGDRTCTARWSGNFLNWASMQTIDTFRWTLTGGDRVIDTVSKTVVRKAFHSGQGGTSMFPTKTIALNVPSVTPMAWASLSVAVQGRGRVMRVGPNAATIQDGTLDAGETDYNVHVQVCVADNDPVLGIPLLEDNCAPYGTTTVNWKPEGLIQQNYRNMRFGVMAYLNDSNALRDGGVLRARLKPVGPLASVPGAQAVANPNAEWSSDTGILVANPDTTDATASGVTSSGVINYLNRFGESGTYKSYDNVSEMYYAALRYLRNAGNVTEWSNNLTAAMKDGYPVITNWDDPMQYACQKNFTIGIGDVYTHRDRNVPGGTQPWSGYEPTMPTAVANDSGAPNAQTWTNNLGNLESMSSLGNQNCGSTAASCYISGMAWWAHTQDIRPDLVGKQTVDFYWVDVMENQQYKDKNQYWLAAKYGSFIDSNGDGKPDIESEWRSTNQTLTWGATTYKLPDTYYTAANPTAMAQSLAKTFSSISASLARNSGLGANTADVGTAASGSVVQGYVPSYDAKYWTGDLRGYSITSDTSGNVNKSLAFSAQSKLDALTAGTGWSSNRRVVAGRIVSGTLSPVPFRAGSLSATQLAALNTDANVASDIVDFLRGDRSNEGTTMRIRSSVLGDIVDSSLAIVSAPNAPYDDGTNPGYAAFKSAKATRTSAVLVGANDGMLHAFNGSLSGGGDELFAYVPSELLNAAPGGSTQLLANLASPNYVHKYTMNGPVRTQDVDFAATNGDNGSGDWRTIAVAGMGKGGRSYVAIDVTDPGAMTSESAVINKVLWEFSDPRLGYTYGSARIFKTRRWGWVVALPSGMNNSDGKGYVFLIDPKTGNLLRALRANEGTATDPLNLAHLGAYIPDFGDYSADSIYGGDMKGNVWRWDVGDAPGTTEVLDDGVFVKGVKIATLTSPSGSAQPVTTEPEIQSYPGTLERFVFVGTGRYLAETDIMLNQTQTLYALRDGVRWAPWTDKTVPTGITLPIDRSELQQLSSLTTGITPSKSKAGWYYDLPISNGGANERVAYNPAAFGGQVVFSSVTPKGDPCSPDGDGRVYVLDFRTGKSVLPVASVQTPGTAVKTSFVQTGSKLSVLITLSGSSSTGATLPSNVKCTDELCQLDIRNLLPSAVNRLNAREIRAD